MADILIRSGWFGRNSREWFEASGDLGDHIVGLADELISRGHNVRFAGSRRSERSNKPNCEIHIEKQFSVQSCPKIAIYCEPSFVQPQNAIPFSHKYEYIYRMDSAVSLKINEQRYWYPRELLSAHTNQWDERDLFVSSISSNKNAVFNSIYNIYNKRNILIKKFSEYFGEKFYLYGGGWELRDHPVGLFAKILFRTELLHFLIKRRKTLVSYRGKCPSKSDIMRRSKFYLCVENTQYPGCITEKIIDCLSFGCVPLYLGPVDIDQMIDPMLFVNLREFKNVEDIFSFIEKFTANDYSAWRARLESKRVDIGIRHSVRGFVDMISNRVEDVLDRAGAK